MNPLLVPTVGQLEALVHEETMLEKPRGLWAGAWRRLLRRKGGVIGSAHDRIHLHGRNPGAR